MGNWGHMMRYGHGGGFMWLIVLVLVGVVIYFLLQVLKSKGSDGSINETPLDILKKRYAKVKSTKRNLTGRKRTWNHKGLFNLKQQLSLTSAQLCVTQRDDVL